MLNWEIMTWQSPAIRRQLATARDAQDFESQVFASNILGTLRLQRGDTDAAAMAYEDALIVAQSTDNYAGMGLSMSNLGLLAATEGRYEDAVKYYETAGNYRSRVGDNLGQANTNNNLGDTYRAMGRLGNAIGAYRLALILGRELESTPVQLHALTGLIDVYSDRADWSQVRFYLDDRLSLVSASGDPWQQLITLQQLGEYYEATEDLESAQTTYQQALTLAQSLQQKQLEGELTNRLIYLARQLGDG
jgi:tetratricopeptide (TPR) repeat protein